MLNRNILIFPIHHSLKEPFTAKVMSSLATGFIETLFYNRLGGNTGMIETRGEQSSLSKHTIPFNGLMKIQLQYTQQVTYHRINASCMAVVRPCPMCKLPVTLGGGAGMTKTPSGLTLPSAVI